MFLRFLITLPFLILTGWWLRDGFKGIQNYWRQRNGDRQKGI
jgi:hypothetical protein